MIPKTVYLNSVTVSDDEERASLFDKYFNSVFTVSSYTLPPDENLPIGDPDCADLKILEEDVLEILSCLDPRKAMGLDAIYQPLHHLFLNSLRQHKIPT